MGRIPRKNPEDGWHHVTNHAVGDEDLFLEDQDRYEFIRRMNEARDKFQVLVAAACLMGNHYHAVVHCPAGNLPSFMHYFQSTYAREFNARHARRGSLLRTEYWSRLLGNEADAATVVRYVHRNPLELGIDIRTYPWSTYLAYTSDGGSAFTVDQEVSENLLGGAVGHRVHVETDSDSDATKFSDGQRQIHHAPRLTVDQSVLELCEIAARRCAMTTQELMAPRTAVLNEPRLAVVLVAYESRAGFAEELRSLLGFRTASSMRSAVARARIRSARSPVFARLVNDLRQEWGPSLYAAAS